MEFLSDYSLFYTVDGQTSQSEISRRKVTTFGLVLALTVLRSQHINMSSEPTKKKAKTSSDTSSPAVSGGDIHFTPELIARMATFASAIKCPDVMNICLAVGPVVSRTIKHFYLWRNKKYLARTLRCLADFYYDASDAATNHRAWMEVNSDWKTRAVGNDSVSEMKRHQLHHILVIGSHPFFAFNSVAFAVELGLLEVVKFLIEDKGVDPNEYGLTFGGDGASYRVHLVSAAMTFDQEAIFKYLLSLPSTNLYSEKDNNPTRNWKHGLFEEALARYVELYSEREKEKPFLTLLVNHNRFDVNKACHRRSTFPASNFPCLFIALERIEKCLGGFEEEHEDPDLTEYDWTKYDSECLDRYIGAIKLLLEAGANPNQSVSDGIGSGADIVERRLRALRPSDSRSIRVLRRRVYGQVLAMMKGCKGGRLVRIFGGDSWIRGA